MEEQYRQENLAGDELQGELDCSSVRSWTVSDVGQWLCRQGFSGCAEKFREHDVSGAELLSLDASDYAELGITQVGVRKRLQEAVTKLRSRMLQVNARLRIRNTAPAPHNVLSRVCGCTSGVCLLHRHGGRFLQALCRAGLRLPARCASSINK